MSARERLSSLYEAIFSRPPGPEAPQAQTELSSLAVAEADPQLTPSPDPVDQLPSLVEASNDTSPFAHIIPREIIPWLNRRFRRSDIEQQFAALPKHNHFLICIEGYSVRMIVREGADEHPLFPVLLERAERYVQHVEDAVREGNGQLNCRLVLCTDDLTEGSSAVPTFSYQRPLGSTVLMFPDIEFLNYDYYVSSHQLDDTLYDDKLTSAGFIGSTSGFPHLNTLETLRNGSSPRIEAAKAFKNVSNVDFRIAHIVQTDGPETDAAIRDLGIFYESAPFHDLYKHKFIISMDGNGATCSRIVLSLRSNSVLMKYASDFEMYYFRDMIPWKHFIPIYKNNEVLEILEYEKNMPGAFANVAAAGKEFYYKNLVKPQVIAYTSALLEAYASLFVDE